MPIAVICPGCKAQFRVSDQFAGKTGPCPKCKVSITIPAATPEVKIHAPVEGPTDSKGRPVSKPLLREETKVGATFWVSLCGGIVVSLGLAFLAGRAIADPVLKSAIGVAVFSVPLVAGGYQFLREEEAAPHRGKALWLRSTICAAVYGLLWVAFWFVPGSWFQEYWSWFYITPPFLVLGAVAAFACLDLELGSGFFHYAFYLAVMVLLRYLAGMPLVWTTTT